MPLIPRLTRSFILLFVVVTLTVAALSSWGAPNLIGVYLMWQQDPTTTITVNWLNEEKATPAQLWYRPAAADTLEKEWVGAGGKRRSVPPSKFQVRSVELTGLQPDTLYEFKLDDAIESSKIRRFRSLPATANRPLRFVVGGDMMHKRTSLDAMNRRAASLDPDFAVLGGDLAYANGRDASRWVDWMQSWTENTTTPDGRCLPMIVAIGNHEVKTGYDGKSPHDAPFFYGLFKLPNDRSYYALDIGDYLSFIVLDSGHTEPVTGKQTQWLGEALTARAERRWLFPIYHFPAYGTAKGENGALPCESKRAIVIRKNWVSLFERHGVSAVFEHDHHNYKRTHPIRNHKVDEQNGIVYLGDGAWGVGTRTVPKNAWYLAKAEPRNHLFHATLHPDGRIQVEAVDVKGVVFDQVTFDRPRTLPQ